MQELPQIKTGAITENFSSFTGKEYTFITGKHPREFDLNTWIPKDKTNYKFQVVKNVSSSKYIEFLNKSLEDKKPIKLVISSKSGINYINGFFVISDFTEGKNKFGDTTINLSLKEWFNYGV